VDLIRLFYFNSTSNNLINAHHCVVEF